MRRRHPLGAGSSQFGVFPARLERAVNHTIPNRSPIVTCYPSNPTACVADPISIGTLWRLRKSTRLVALDLATPRSYFDDIRGPRCSRFPGASMFAVRITSMSIAYFRCPAWRIGFAVGNERIIAALGAGEVLSRLTRIPRRFSGGRRPRSTARRLHSRDCVGFIGAGATPWWNRRAAPDGVVPPRGASMFALGADPRAVPAARQRPNSPRSWSRRRAWRVAGPGPLRRARRRPCAHRAGGERAAHPSGPPAISGAFLKRAGNAAQRRTALRRDVSRPRMFSFQVSGRS